ncbi:MAG: transcriptional repressor LexA [Proteobacteria bacterium]|nr:transcriptional repressor LexA [Pseudomonadota bacterium]
MVQGLTTKQRLVLQAIQDYWNEHGVPPTLADLEGMLGVRRSTVHQHLQALKKKGYLDHTEGTRRTWRPTATEVPDERSRRVPIVGRVAAGAPILAQQNIDGWVTVDHAPANATLFALRVRGDSMLGAGIHDGDIVIVRKQQTAQDGDIVVALIDNEEATVKQLRRHGGRVQLIAKNAQYKPIVVAGERVRVQGKVIGLRRQFDK